MRIALLAVFLIGCVVALPGRSTASDLVIRGCNELQAGELGMREAIGDVGDTVRVAITVNATTPIGAFVLDFDVPAGLLTYVKTERGDLTSPWAVLDGHWFSSTSQVRVGGFDAVGIRAGAIGRLAVLVFVVAAAGTGDFGTSGLQDDLATYSSCEDSHVPSHVTSLEWGSIKSLYRP